MKKKTFYEITGVTESAYLLNHSKELLDSIEPSLISKMEINESPTELSIRINYSRIVPVIIKEGK